LEVLLVVGLHLNDLSRKPLPPLKKTVTPTETIMVEVIDGVFVEKQKWV